MISVIHDPNAVLTRPIKRFHATNFGATRKSILERKTSQRRFRVGV